MLFTIHNLLQEGRPLVTVCPSDPIAKALGLMAEHDYSQLPIVNDDGRALGEAVTHASILRAVNNFKALPDKLTVRDAKIRARKVRFDFDLLEVLDDIEADNFVLVVDGDERLKGIVTTCDTTAYFRRFAEDMMLVQDIETSIRDAISALYDEKSRADVIQRTTDKAALLSKEFRQALNVYLSKLNLLAKGIDKAVFEEAFTKFTVNRTIKSFENLSFHDIQVIFLDHRDCPKLSTSKDVSEVRILLEAVRNTRNKLAHFRGEVTAEERDRLRFCSDWLTLHAPSPRPQPPGAVKPPVAKLNGEESPIAPSEEPVSATDSTYAQLAIFLKSQPPEVDERTMTFTRIEEIINYKLPKSAHEHRAWWANDPLKPQAAQWLDVGWRAQHINLTGGRVTFIRIVEREKAYITFFCDVMERLRKHQEFPLKEMAPQGVSWHTLHYFRWKTPASANLVASFTRQKQLRVELYLDCGDAASNKERFDELHSKKDAIESALGVPLSWERLDDKRASRIAMYTPADITADGAVLKAASEWAVQGAVSLQRVFSSEFE
jgi:CBS domain-containing protein